MPQLNLPDLLSAVKFNPDANIEPDKIYFSITDAIIGTAGNFITFSGLPKAGKSTFISAIVASFVSNSEIFDFRAFNHDNSRKIALFDTEQTNFDFSRTIQRIKKLAKTTDIFKNLDCFLLREQSAFEILHLINYYLRINEGKTGIVIIDGVLDCLNSFNDEAESKKLIRILKKWASKYQCLIITVLHTGKQSGQTLGHYGSMSDRYSQSTINIEKTKEGSFVCSPKFLRSAGDFPAVEIVYNKILNTYEKL